MEGSDALLDAAVADCQKMRIPCRTPTAPALRRTFIPALKVTGEESGGHPPRLRSGDVCACGRALGPNGARWGKVLFVIIALILYGALINYVGFLVVTFLLIAFLLRFVDPQSWKKVLGWALIGSIGAYLIFEVWIKLRLPKGFFGV